MENFKFCELGAVSPDYPYLALLSGDQAHWADAMHYDTPGGMIRSGMHAVRSREGYARDKAFAWLLGYASHVAADLTIHPVVEAKVGRYQENKTDHRICEMHQDAFIFRRMNLADVGQSEFLDSGIATCGDRRNGVMDGDIETLWLEMLRDVYPAKFGNNAEARIQTWHKSFVTLLDDVAEEGYRLFAFARHVSASAGLTYPSYADAVKSTYVTELETPDGDLHYDDVFNRAINNASQYWGVICAYVYGEEDSAAEQIVVDCDLDTGKIPSDDYVFWS